VTRDASQTLHALLHTVVDYAGLFPPAGLDMEPAVRNYAQYRRSPHAWMLGRFVVPVARLDEMTAAMRAAGDDGDGGHWRASALVGEDVAGDVARIAAFNAAGRGAVVDAVEVKASDAAAIRAVAAAMPAGLRAYVEIPVAGDPRALIGAIAEAKLRAKIRTGGVTPAAFPPPDHVTRFIRGCYATATAFKATAGLHHPLRSMQPLTYADDAPRGIMHGFLNVFLVAVFHYNGLTIRDADELMTREAVDDVAFTDDALMWRDYRVSRDEIATIRRRFAISFGSCSFREPVDDLVRTGLLS
jgi:hypothetical protein